MYTIEPSFTVKRRSIVLQVLDVVASCFYHRLFATILCFLLGLSSAHAQPQMPPPSWADHAETLKLEKLLYEAVQSKDTHNLPAVYKEIKEKDGPAIDHILDVVSSDDKEEASKISFNMSPCHYSGMVIRTLIIGAYEDAKNHKNKLITPLPLKLTDIFSVQMYRCELIKRMPFTKRLVGASAEEIFKSGRLQ